MFGDRSGKVRLSVLAGAVVLVAAGWFGLSSSELQDLLQKTQGMEVKPR